MTRQQVADLGALQLESGDVLRDCRIGYRVTGRPDASKGNVVLVVPWFQGTSRQLVPYVGRDRLVDDSQYLVILVDPLGNGVSSSPSNSRHQPGKEFPALSIRDIAASHHRLLTEILGVRRLAAVIGFSMGGMIVFQSITSYPSFMDKAISIVGSPQTQPDDRRRWEERIVRLANESAWTRTRAALRRRAPRTAFNEWRMKTDDHICQGAAIASHDISAFFGGSMERVCSLITARLLVAGTWRDEEVSPAPAFEFARLARADCLVLDGRCGHQAPNCEQVVLWRTVRRFLAE
jgi:homoserine O-acetyltransferase/O-succinyltransferase